MATKWGGLKRPKNSGPVGQEGSIGQPIGKLPTKHTTEHVARTPMMEGAINDKGQKKTIDKKTGKTRWIDMKEAKVMGPAGVPVKPTNENDTGAE